MNQIYDGTNSASAVPTIVSGSLVSGGVAAFGETFDTKNVGIGKTLSPVGSVNDGNGGNDYAATFLASTLGVISPRALTATAVSNTKAYDGTISAAAGPAITGGSLAAGDTAVFSETYNTPLVGTGLTLSPAGTVSDGNAGANYSVAFVNNTSGVITQSVDHFLLTASPASVTAGESLLLAVTAEDATGNIVTGYSGTVALQSGDPLAPTPAADLTFQAGGGVASFGGLSIDQAGSYTLSASSAAVPVTGNATSGSFNVTPGPAAQLTFASQPGPVYTDNSGVETETISTVTVAVEDQYGNTVTMDNSAVTLSLNAAASGGGGVLYHGTATGPVTESASGGVATFSGLSIVNPSNNNYSDAGTGYTFTASDTDNGTTFTYTDTNTGLANSGGGTAALARGIPISLSGPTTGVTSGQFTLTYNSSDLTISGAVVDPNLAASYGATLSLDASSTPGNAIIDFSTTAALPSASSTSILLGGITATAPSAAYYKAKDLLHFSSVSLEAGGSSVATIGTDALHLVTFPGNASGTGAIISADTLDMARVVAGADAGFAAYPLIDPEIRTGEAWEHHRQAGLRPGADLRRVPEHSAVELRHGHRPPAVPVALPGRHPAGRLPA